jgi:uncharacterized protein (DUF2252 family)
MARSAHAYVRGSAVTLRMVEREEGPFEGPVWICGDCHAGTCQSLALTDARHPDCDLDQTVIAIRLMT